MVVCVPPSFRLETVATQGLEEQIRSHHVETGPRAQLIQVVIPAGHTLDFNDFIILVGGFKYWEKC